MIDHIKLHLKKKCFYCSSLGEKSDLKFHTSSSHPVKLFKFDFNFEQKTTNWIIDFINNQFRLVKRYKS